MSLQFPRPSRRLAWLLLPLALPVLARAAGLAPSGASLTVCPINCTHTTVQDAINAAVDGDAILLQTTAPHSEFGIVVDKSVTLRGLGIVTTTLQAAVLPNTAPGPVLAISPGKTVHIEDIFLRHGNAALGGGIYNDGGDVTLSRVRVEVNNATSGGGGIYNTSTGTMALDGTSVALNTAALGDGGGIYNAGAMSLTDSFVADHAGVDRGAGIFNTGNLTLRATIVLRNAADAPGGANLRGGGIYNEGTVTLIDSVLFDNAAGMAVTPHAGGGIFSSGELISYGSGFLSNDAFQGAGLYLQGDATIERTVIAGNGQSVATNSGGGLLIYAGGNTVTIVDSTIGNNQATAGAGMLLGGSGEVSVTNTTVSGNVAVNGAGVAIVSDGIKLTNTTVSGNSAVENGGGVYVATNGEVDLINVTISDNTADSDDDESGNGGGLYLPTSNNQSGVARLHHALIAGNHDLSDIPSVISPDCHGEVESLGYNLIGTLGFSLGNTPCSVAGETTGNQIGVDAMLDVLMDNGGWTSTHALLPGSAAIDAGDPAGCEDAGGLPLVIDQRGALRVDRCDVGAFELGGLLPRGWLSFISGP